MKEQNVSGVILPLIITWLSSMGERDCTFGQLVCWNDTSQNRTIYPDNGEMGVHVEITHPKLDPYLDLVPGENYTVKISTKDDSFLQELTVYEDTSQNEDPAVVYHSCVVKLPIQLQWTVGSRSDESCHTLIFVIFQNDTHAYKTNKTICRPPGCREYKKGNYGKLLSVNYPDLYPDDFHCVYVIYTEEKQSLHLQVQVFDLEEKYGDTCFDFIQLSYDSFISNQICGHKKESELRAMHYTSETGLIYLTFQTDSKIHKSGFEAMYYTKDGDTDCNITLKDTDGYIHSPRYPGHYPPNTKCFIKLELPPKYRIHFQIHSLELPPPIAGVCMDDVIEIYSSNSNDSRTFCGNMENLSAVNLTYKSSTSVVYIVFVSNHVTELRGFHISYHGVLSCINETFTETNGTLYSVNYPNEYLNQQNCLTTIHALEEDFQIELSFEMFHTQSVFGDIRQKGDICNLDYVEIQFNEKTERVCGDWTGMEYLLHYVSGTNWISLRFVSNENVTKAGYVAKWRIFDNRKSDPIQCNDGQFAAGKHCYELILDARSWDDSNMECERRGADLAKIPDFETQQDMEREIKLRNDSDLFDAFWVGANDRLYEDDFYWLDGSILDFKYWFPGWSQFNYSHRQPSDDGLANEDCVELRSKFNYPGKGFGMTSNFYWNDRQCSIRNPFICQFRENNDNVSTPLPPTSCDEAYQLSEYQPEVIVKSPGYPDDYERLKNCRIEVKTPPGGRIALHFQHFRLENSAGCIYDSVAVKFSPFSNEIVHCGNWEKKLKKISMISPSNYLSLRFTSDHNIQFSGFVAKIRYNTDDVCNSTKNSSGSWLPGPLGCYHIPNKGCRNHSTALDVCRSIGGQLPNSFNRDEHFFVENNYNLCTGNCDCDNVSQLIWLNTGEELTSAVKGNITDSRCLAVDIGSPYLYSSDAHKLLANSLSCDAQINTVCITPKGEETSTNATSVFSEAEGNISSPGFPNTPYPDRYRHEYRFICPSDHRLLFTLEPFQLEPQEECLYDTLDTYGMLEDKSYCGQNDQTQYFMSKLNNATIIFQTDESVRKKGFRVHWKVVNVSKCFDVMSDGNRTSVHTLNYPEPYLDAMSCCETIYPPQNDRVVFQIQSFHLPTDNKEAGVLTINYINQEGKEVVHEFTRANKTIFVSERALQLCIRSPFINKGQGLAAEINYVTDNGLVNKSLYVPLNEFITDSSVHFPENFPANFEQSTFLRTDVGNVVGLSFEILNLPSDDTCSDDLLQVIDDSTGSHRSEVLAEYSCKRSRISSGATYTSFLNRLVLKVKSGPNVNGKRLRYEIKAFAKADPFFINKTTTISDGLIDTCSNFTCFHNATCSGQTEENGRFRCICLPQFTGLFCQVTVCTVDPCLYGLCNLTATGYTCACDPHYWGSTCHMDDAQCRYQQCSGNGVCTRGESYEEFCLCNSGWTGSRCDMSIPQTKEKVSISERLLQEPIWIGMIVMLNLLVIFCAAYVIRRKCGDKILEMLPKKKQRPTPSESEHKYDNTPCSSPMDIYSLNIELTSNDNSCLSTPQVQKPRRFIFEKIIDSCPNSPVIDENNKEIAARFFDSYRNTIQLLKPPAVLERKPSILVPRSPEPSPYGNIFGGAFVFNADNEHKVRASSDDNIIMSYLSNSNGSRKDEFTVTRNSRLHKNHSYSGPSRSSSPHAPVKAKSTEERSVGEQVHHYYPKILIVNEKKRQNDSDHCSLNSNVDHDRSGEESQLRSSVVSVDPQTDSGYRSTNKSSSNSETKPPSITDLAVPALSSAKEKRKLFLSKSVKSASFYHLADYSDSLDDSVQDSLPVRRTYHTQDPKKADLERESYHITRGFTYDSDTYCLNCRKEKENHRLQHCYSCESHLEYDDPYSDRHSRSSHNRLSNKRRKKRYHIRCRCHELSLSSRDTSRQRRSNYKISSASSNSSDRYFAYSSQGSRERKSKRISAIDVERSNRRRNNIASPGADVSVHSDTSYLHKRKKVYKRRQNYSEGSVVSSSSMNDRRHTDEFSKSLDYVNNGFKPIKQSGRIYRSERRTKLRNSDIASMPASLPSISYKNEKLVAQRSLTSSPEQTTTENTTTDLSESDKISSVKRKSVRQQHPVQKPSMYRQSSQPFSPTYIEGIDSTAFDYQQGHRRAKDSAYQTQQPSLDRVPYARKDTETESIDADSQEGSVDETTSSYEEKKVSKDLRQAALKLAFLKRMKSHGGISKDSAINTFSEDESFCEDAEQIRHRPLSKRSSGSLQFQIKEPDLTKVTEENTPNLPSPFRKKHSQDEATDSHDVTSDSGEERAVIVLSQNTSNIVTCEEIELAEINI